MPFARCPPPFANRGACISCSPRAYARHCSDQNDPKVFEYFLEKNMISFFDQIMVQDAAAGVNTQLLQVRAPRILLPLVLPEPRRLSVPPVAEAAAT